jgi:hypothetical protein
MTRKLPKRSRAKGKVQETLGKRVRIGLWSGALAVATLLGYVVLIPRVTPSISSPINPINPFSSSITITNSGNIPLDSVSVSVKIRAICGTAAPVCPNETQYPDPTRFDDIATTVHHPEWVDRHLSIDGRFDFSMGDSFFQPPDEPDTVTLKFADIAVVVDYQLPIIHWKMHKQFPLYTRKASNGTLYWVWG